MRVPPQKTLSEDLAQGSYPGSGCRLGTAFGERGLSETPKVPVARLAVRPEKLRQVVRGMCRVADKPSYVISGEFVDYKNQRSVRISGSIHLLTR